MGLRGRYNAVPRSLLHFLHNSYVFLRMIPGLTYEYRKGVCSTCFAGSYKPPNHPSIPIPASQPYTFLLFGRGWSLAF